MEKLRDFIMLDDAVTKPIRLIKEQISFKIVTQGPTVNQCPAGEH